MHQKPAVFGIEFLGKEPHGQIEIVMCLLGPTKANIKVLDSESIEEKSGASDDSSGNDDMDVGGLG
jgi:hypothetical protein